MQRNRTRDNSEVHSGNDATVFIRDTWWFYLSQCGDRVGLHLICQDTVCDVSNGQTHRPRALASILHELKRSTKHKEMCVRKMCAFKLYILMPNPSWIGDAWSRRCAAPLDSTTDKSFTPGHTNSCQYLSNNGLVELDPDAISGCALELSPVLLITATARQRHWQAQSCASFPNSRMERAHPMSRSCSITGRANTIQNKLNRRQMIKQWKDNKWGANKRWMKWKMNGRARASQTFM